MNNDEKLIRTFLSIPVPAAVRSKKNMLYSTIDEEFKVNWVKNINLHLTIKFLDYTPESEIPKLLLAIEEVTKTLKPFDLLIEETGCFPIKERPKVLWLGISGVLKPLEDIIEKFENLLDGFGFQKEENSYTPHITIARIKYPQKKTPNIYLFLNSTYDPINFSADRIHFFSSELLPTGALYTLIKSFPLGESF